MNLLTTAQQILGRLSSISSLVEYGAVLDGVTDDLIPIQRMVDFIGANASTLLVSGPCSVSVPITIPSNIVVRFEASGSFVGAGAVTYTSWLALQTAPPVTLALAGNWVTYGGAWVVQQYSISTGRVFLAGLVKNIVNPVSLGSNITNLPIGARPQTNNKLCGVWASLNSAVWQGLIRLDILPTGDINFQGVGTGAPSPITSVDFLSFEGVSFNLRDS